ncbi:Nuclear factor to kappa-B-binding protein [Paragonimus heterotremus]|uniref:Nuclear factor to kappa-B-binding protein n=1 Tax=Paragonimus heterotremus TaxID=100268 RepID=A0A8J4T628_9TREM|nr:Nuclear factor to kappa-B-binding protein [Paragonimus heterotremus]
MSAALKIDYLRPSVDKPIEKMIGGLASLFESLKDCVADYFTRLTDKRSTQLDQLRERIVQLKSLVREQESLTVDEWCANYGDPNFLEVVDPKLLSRATASFNKFVDTYPVSDIFCFRLMQDVKNKAKGLESADPEDPLPTVAGLLREHLASTDVSHCGRRLSDIDRLAVGNLLRDARVRRKQKRFENTKEDQYGHLSDVVKFPRDLKTKRPVGSLKRRAVGSVKRKSRPATQSTSCTSLTRKGLDITWPSAEHGFFCLLRGFLTQGGERRRLTTAQLCEYVREWQTQNGLRLQRAGSCWSWISRTDDWSAVTPYALQFLTAENIPPSQNSSSGLVRHSTRRLVCPRPFVDSRPRVHQWSWLMAPPPTGSTVNEDVEVIRAKFNAEAKELADLSAEWVRAPRGLGGLSDAELLASASITASGGGVVSRRKGGNIPTAFVDDQSRDSDDSGRLQILGGYMSDLEYDDDDADADEEEPVSKRDRATHGSGRRRHVSQFGSKTTSALDDSIPLPLCPTTWRLRPFSPEEKRVFQVQENQRFARPWLPFVYHIQDYTAVVGPLRSAPSATDARATSSMLSNGAQARARDHPLLRSDRPIHVSLAEIVRDAVACLPNGEGTRADITTLVQNSGFLLAIVDPRKLQQCVSSALDRLQGEAADPSVYFNAARRVWVYRHRHRTAEEFAELHEARCAVNEAKRSLQRGGDPRMNSLSKFHSTALPSHQHPTPRESSFISSRCTPPTRGRPSVSGGPSHLQRHLGLPRSDFDDDAFSDAHIPDIEELEAEDMMRRVRGDDAFDYSEPSSSYGEDDDEEEEEDYEHSTLNKYDLEALRNDEFIVEPADYMVDDGDYLYPAHYPPASRRVTEFNRHTPSHAPVRCPPPRRPTQDDFFELHRSLRR